MLWNGRVRLAGFAVLFILLDRSDGDDFTNIRTGNSKIPRERIWTLYFLAYWKVMRKFTKKWLIDFTKNAVFKFAYYIWTLVYWKQMNVKIRFQWHLMTYNDIWWRTGTISGNNHLLCGWNKYAYGVKGSHLVLKFRMFRRDSLNCGTESGSEKRMKQMSNLKLHWLWK